MKITFVRVSMPVVLSVLVAVLSCHASAPFELHSSIWVNLHHYLYNEAFRAPKAHQAISALSPSESETLAKAIAFYKTEYAGRDLLFDERLQRIQSQLSAIENDGSLDRADIPSELRVTLSSVYPLYQARLWERQNAENVRWIEQAKRLLAGYGAPIRRRLEKVLHRRFSDGPYRIDVVHEASWQGAYTFAPPHTVISSGRADYADWASLEMLFHEALHAGPFDVIQTAIDRAFASRKRRDHHQLWHAIHFFTVGEVVRDVLRENGIEYVPYAVKNGLFASTRDWGKIEPLLRRYWVPYLEGKAELTAALADIVDAIPLRSPGAG